MPSAVTEIVSPSGLTEPCVIGGIGGSRSAGGGVRLAYIGSSGGNGGFSSLHCCRIRGFRRGLFTDLGRVLGSFRRRGGG